MALQGNYINYITRSYQQIVEAVLNSASSNVPEITDHTDNELFVKIIKIYAGIAEMLGYYIDVTGQEAFVTTMRLYASAIAHARMFDYRVRRPIPAAVYVRFRLASPATGAPTIPEGTVVSNAEGTVYFSTVEDIQYVNGTTDAYVFARQYNYQAPQSEVIVADGGEFQQYTMTELARAAGEGLVTVVIGGDTWSQVDTLGYSLPTDKHVIVTVNMDRDIVLMFGDGVNGARPNAGTEITVTYFNTLGFAGNVAPGVLDTMVSSPAIGGGNTISEVYNEEQANGGLDTEDLESLRYRLPLSLRTMLRAVRYQDYIDVAELAPGVRRAGLIWDCGKTVDVYIVPDGGGLAIPLLCEDTEEWFEDRRMLTTRVRVFPAGMIHLLLTYKLYIRNGYVLTDAVTSVKTDVAQFLSYFRQRVRGQVNLSDIYEVIEANEAVDHSEIISIGVVPYPRRLPGTDTNLLWTPVPSPSNMGSSVYRIRFIDGAGHFHLTRRDVDGDYFYFLLEGNVTTPVVLDDITFTVLAAAYVNGDEYEFITYPFTPSTLRLLEPALPISLTSDMTVTAVYA